MIGCQCLLIFKWCSFNLTFLSTLPSTYCFPFLNNNQPLGAAGYFFHNHLYLPGMVSEHHGFWNSCILAGFFHNI
ncbi:unnamed protein product [Musa hybrid cultivar]